MNNLKSLYEGELESFYINGTLYETNLNYWYNRHLQFNEHYDDNREIDRVRFSIKDDIYTSILARKKVYEVLVKATTNSFEKDLSYSIKFSIATRYRTIRHLHDFTINLDEEWDLNGFGRFIDLNPDDINSHVDKEYEEAAELIEALPDSMRKYIVGE